MSRPKIKPRKKASEGSFDQAGSLVGEDLGKCPFCDGKIGIVRKQMAVLHSMPQCAKFEAEDPMMFLRNVRMKTVGRVPNDDEWPMPVKQEPS